MFGNPVLVIAASVLLFASSSHQQTKQTVSAASTPSSDFTCPEDFGYFPHPTDCTQYYVCVFGGALLESCTGGLMYSHDLQTCDWPRNVYCYNGTTFVDNNIDGSRAAAQQQSQPQRTRGGGGSAASIQTAGGSRSSPSSYAYTPIKIETYGQLSRAAEESIGGKKVHNSRVVLPDDEYQQQRSGRSYEGSLPNYKEEIYQSNQGSPVSETRPPDRPPPTHRRKRSSEKYRRRSTPPPRRSHKLNRRRASIFTRRRTPRAHRHEQSDNYRRLDSTPKYSMPAGLKNKPMSSAMTHRVSSPGNILYPPSYYQTPTYGFVNIDTSNYQTPVRLRPNPLPSLPVRSLVSSTTTTPSPPPRVVKITTSKPVMMVHGSGEVVGRDNAHDGSYYSSQNLRLIPNNKYVPMVLGEYHSSDPYHHHHHQHHHQNSLAPHRHNLLHHHHHHAHAQQNLVKPNLSLESYSQSTGRWKLVNNHGQDPFYSFEVDRDVPHHNHNHNHHHPHQHPAFTPRPQQPQHTKPTTYEQDKRLSAHVTNSYVDRLKGGGGAVSTAQKKPTSPPPLRISSSGSVSSSPLVNTNTRSKFGSTSKYYDNAAPVAQQQPQRDEYSTTDDVYVNQRYAANVGNNTNYYYAPAGEEDDASYYVYDDEEEEAPTPQQPQTPQKYNNDFDYKYAGQQQYTRTPVSPTPQQIVTRRPVQAQVQPVSPTQSTRTASRTRTRTSGTSSGSSSSSSTSTRGSRPTLKPKSSIVKGGKNSAPVRDVYLDAASRPENVYETPTSNTPSTKCRKDLCVLPDCNCGGKEIPGGLRAQETPQIVLLTFDDSVNDLNKNLYRDLFEKGRKNPNGCPISATFYVSHEWTDYSQVQNLAADGHEIASHSVSHSFGEQYSQKKWDREINGQREILAAYGGVKLSEVRGMRAPFLAIGGNNMFKMLHDSNFTYDSSMPVYENRPPSWPYTLDYRIFHDCMIPPCPTKSYPGVWEVPMVMWQDLKGGRCSMGDACSNPPTAEGVYQMLAKNFERHYTTNRAPFGLYYHAAWFTQPHHKEGFEAFLDTLVQMDDVWLVTNWQALQWIRNPTPSNRVLNFEPWSCHDLKDRPPRCNHPKVCNLWHKSGVRYMKTCQQCPQQYPWTGNTGVPYSNSV